MPDNNFVVEVVEAIAQSDDKDPLEMDFTIADHIDPEVLEKLGDMEDGVWEFTFRISDHQVRLAHDGAIFVNGVKYESGAARQE